MRIVVQRVTGAAVSEREAGEVARIGAGMVVLLGIETTDTKTEADRLCTKLSKLRIFEDAPGMGNMNAGLDAHPELEVMVVSQFTLYADVRKGNRPSFIRSATGTVAEPLYEYFCDTLSRLCGRPVKRGVFGGHMQVSLVNDGPVTIIIDSDTI